MHAWWLKWYDWMNDSNRLMIHAHDRLHARDDINAYECCIMWLMFYHAIDRMHVCYCRCLLLVFTCFNDLEICNKTWHDWMTWKRLKLKWLTARKTRRGLPRARRGIRDRNFEIDVLGKKRGAPYTGRGAPYDVLKRWTFCDGNRGAASYGRGAIFRQNARFV